ncbi:cysteine desulfurase [Acididesulfobacillus acetoxydans]|uniref:cysteine desulfurase n=1 Tax=Acididesulfobacillus acetoxydans TaxID=1561005 RepID=A0A8S0XX66_9FIRM|nr:aminotransferase class V-fold PLP-dependent enzyme [Acididesulfobacillus acetoxydans]CAA7601517.1 cysteine desulfurase [Acididesulfobacillus acetoxydans]CEJ07004.1 Cysteine desulfurase 2, chloroplastic [Acididesulfobacillus acetoxydans]
MIYLDNAATTWPKPEDVGLAVQEALMRKGGNAGRGGHGAAMQMARLIHQTRVDLCTLFGTNDPTRVIFTQNATHALNLALFGLMRPGDHVITSSLEHNAVARPLYALGQRGVEVSEVPGVPGAEFDLAAYRKAFRSNTKLVVTLHASNVTGTMLPIREIGQIAHERGVYYLLDAAQTAGVFPIDMKRLPLDLLAFPGHKALLGPQGTGGLLINADLQLEPLIYGGTGSLSEEVRQPDFLPDALESGTLNGIGLAGLGAGVRYILTEGMDKIRVREQELCRKLWEGLKKIPGVKLYGNEQVERRAPIIAFNLGEMDSVELSYILEERAGIVARAGLHCASQAHRMIGTLDQGVVRFSPSHFTTAEEIDAALQTVRDLAQGLN